MESASFEQQPELIIDYAMTPEPASLVLFGTGLVAAARIAFRRPRKAQIAA